MKWMVNFCQNKFFVYVLEIIIFVLALWVLTGLLKTVYVLSDIIIFCCLWCIFPFNRLLKFLFLIPLCLILFQVLSIVSTGEYVVPLTILNLNEYSSLGSKALVKISVLFLVLGGIGISILCGLKRFTKYKVNLGLYIASLVLFACFYANSPILNLVNSSCEAYKQYTFGADAYIKEKMKRLYYKETVYSEDNLSAESRKIVDNINLKGKNVIVFFIEGFNYNNLSYVNKFANLTPNLDSLLVSSISFKNYYNHTAATFRGLRGQLTSSYQYLGGYYQENNGIGQIATTALENKYRNTVYSMPDILKNHGYQSYFINPHSEESNTSTMLKTMHFDHVYGCESSKECDINLPVDSRMITDRALFENISNILTQIPKDKPFFIGVYNIGTHLGMDSPDEKYTQNEIILNSVYNFDYQFGKFYSWFKQSDLYDNTVIVITADHSAFPSDDRAKIFGDESIYQGIFINTIPFIVSYNGATPLEYDVHGKNSINFVPTMLHLMRIKDGSNYFLGCSFFEKCKHNFEYYEAIGDSFYTTENNELRSISKNNDYPNMISDFYNLSDATLNDK
mgnify:CR=1 FL=1